MKEKKYIIEIIQKDKKFYMNRKNQGFSVYEMIGFIELIRSELVLQAKSLFNDADITREFTHDKLSGNIIIKSD